MRSFKLSQVLRELADRIDQQTDEVDSDSLMICWCVTGDNSQEDLIRDTTFFYFESVEEAVTYIIDNGDFAEDRIEEMIDDLTVDDDPPVSSVVAAVQPEDLKIASLDDNVLILDFYNTLYFAFKSEAKQFLQVFQEKVYLKLQKEAHAADQTGLAADQTRLAELSELENELKKRLVDVFLVK